MDRKNLWAPWRISYIQGLGEKHECFICHNFENPAQDRENYVLWRTKNCMVILNKFPYNNGHLLITPNRHVPGFEGLDDTELLEMNKLILDCQHVLSKTINPHGFNVGMNFGRCAGAGLPGHLHTHVVPRWDGDTNFMAVCGHTDVISQGLDELYDAMVKVSEENNLPNV